MKLPKYRLLKQYNTIVTALTVDPRTLYFLSIINYTSSIPVLRTKRIKT